MLSYKSRCENLRMRSEGDGAVLGSIMPRLGGQRDLSEQGFYVAD